VLDQASLPSLGIGGELSGAMRFSRLELRVKTQLLATGSAYVSGSQSQGANVWLVGADAGACVVALDKPRWAIETCASLGPEWLFAKGFGAMTSSNATATVGTATFGLDPSVRLASRFGLRASFDAVVPFTRPYFYVEETGGSQVAQEFVFRLPPVAARASIGVEVHF
jgi:hypothetical protein